MPRRFRPGTSGLHFSNAEFIDVPLATIDLMTLEFGGLAIEVGNARNGLCGGMVFTALDYYHAGRMPPSDTSPPMEGPFFEYLVDRLFDSFNLPEGPARYLYLMNPAFPDAETPFSDLGIGPHGRAWVMIKEEWPKIRKDLDRGDLSPLGLIRIESANPLLLGKNHQVLAYAYELDRSKLAIRIYDPNFPDRDDVVLELNLANPSRQTVARQSPGKDSICFFRTDYQFKSPP